MHATVNQNTNTRVLRIDGNTRVTVRSNTANLTNVAAIKDTPTPTPSPTSTVKPTPKLTGPANLHTETPTPSPTPVVLVAGQIPPDAAPPISVTTAPAVAISAIAIALTLAGAFIAKRLFNRWKYGKNALKNLRGLKKAVRVQNDLMKKWLKKRRSINIHAIGVGKIDGTENYCIQVFVEDANGDMLEDPPTRLLPTEYRQLPIVIYEMPRADLLSLPPSPVSPVSAEEARQAHTVLLGGISGANANLSSESGTIGYFFRPSFIDKAAHMFLKKHVYLLSNAHVFADLTRETMDATDQIMQPSPGESAASQPVAELYDHTPLIFGGDVEKPNFVDGAIAKLYRGRLHRADIPCIGAITGYLRKEQVELGSGCHKFGRTTGYTTGRVFSIHLSIWVKYSARGREAFFKDQFLIVPTDGTSFVRGGDSGSLLADTDNRAIGLIFAGAGEKSVLQFTSGPGAADLANLAATATPKIDSYGVANSISDVMSRFNIKLDG